jgi:hypothetical protein
MRKALLLIAIISANFSYAQPETLKSRLYKLEYRIIIGDKEALREMALYLDNTGFVQEYLGYHRYPSSAREIAMRVLVDNCLFLPNELQLDSTVSAARFLRILEKSQVVFDELTGSFLIVPLQERETGYQLKGLSEPELAGIDTVVIQSPYPGWYYQNQIDGFLLNTWYAKRYRFNRYYFADEEFLNLMKKLTHVELGVPGKDGKITFLYKDDYYAVARLNYLIYWATHYTDYRWNEKMDFFENVKETAGYKSKEEILFGMLDNKNDSLAADVFTQLSELNPEKVRDLSDEYEKNSMPVNFSIPTFPFRFLKQMTILTRYCRENGIRYKVAGWLADSLERLKDHLDYAGRYRLENDIINKLSVDEVTIVEYFGLLNEKRFWSTYSIGRILDKFYSLRWREIINEKKYLALYLKKSMLFDNLDIVGICGKYLRKFENCTPDLQVKIKSVISSVQDTDIIGQARKVLSLYSVPAAKKGEERKATDKKYGVPGLERKFTGILRKYKNDSDKRRWEIQKLLARINYSQIGKAIQMLLKDTSIESHYKFWFIENDFGLDINEYDTASVAKFLQNYSTKSEYDLYEYYLRKTGIRYTDSMGNLSFVDIYAILKYDVVDAFAGGGGGRREDGVYPLIRLLELRFNTRLGFPEKFCDSQGVYSCDCTDRAKAWRSFLEEKQLVFPDLSEPVSVSENK